MGKGVYLEFLFLLYSWWAFHLTISQFVLIFPKETCKLMNNYWFIRSNQRPYRANKLFSPWRKKFNRKSISAINRPENQSNGDLCFCWLMAANWYLIFLQKNLLVQLNCFCVGTEIVCLRNDNNTAKHIHMQSIFKPKTRKNN